MGQEVEGEVVNDAVVTEPVVDPPAPIGTTPWYNDLAAALGPDNTEAIAKADKYLAEKWQPRVTQLEQSQNTDANALWEAFEDNPFGAFQSVAQQLFPDDVDKIIEVLTKQAEIESTTPVTDPPATTSQIDLASLPPEVREIVEANETSKMLEAYNAEVARIKELHPSLNEALFNPFVVATDGDMEAALVLYKEDEALRNPQAAVEDPPAQVPPPAIGSDTATATTPPAAKSYSKWADIDDALGDMIAETKTSPPPTVGSV